MTKDKKVAILQSSYIPWRGYFGLINEVDEFILFDDMQFTKRDWRSRNKIKSINGSLWLSIPVISKGKYHQKIQDVLTLDNRWRKKHFSSIVQSYSKAPYYKDYISIFEELYLNSEIRYLSEINFHFIKSICEILRIPTKISWSKDYNAAGGKTERLVGLTKQADGTHYISGPAAKSYIETNIFELENIKLHWADYSGLPLYEQIHGEFDANVSILDLIFMKGSRAKDYIKIGIEK